MLWQPSKVAFAGMVVWLIIWLASPLVEKTPLDFGALVFIGACYAAFFFGCVMGRRRQSDWFVGGRQLTTGGWVLSRKVFITVSSVGIVGVLSRFIDRTLIRGVDYSQEFYQIREVLESSSVSLLGMVGSLLQPFCFLPLILLLTQKWNPRQIGYYGIAGVLFALPMLESFGQLSRSIMLVTVALGFAAFACLKYRGNPFDRTIVLPTFAIAVSLLVASAVIFDTRLQDWGWSLEESIIASAYADHIGPNPEAMEGLFAGAALEHRYYTAVLPNSMYYLSGVYEFSVLWTRPDEQQFSMGAYLFYPAMRAGGAILGIENFFPFDQEVLVYRTGVFNSFFGPIWIDFGWFGLVFMFAMGYLSVYLSRQVRSGALNLLPLYLYLVVVLIYMPVVNFLLFGGGTFTLASFVLFAIFARRENVNYTKAKLGSLRARTLSLRSEN